MTFDKVGAPVYLSGRPSMAINIPVVHTLLIAVQPTFNLEPEGTQLRYEKIGRVTAIEKGMRKLGGLQRSFSSKNCPNWPSSSSVVIAILPCAWSTRTDNRSCF